MSFEDVLSKVVNRVEGGTAAIILGVDGIPIERYTSDFDSSLDIEAIGTEFTTLLRRSIHTASDTALGELNELVFATDKMFFLIRPITNDYFILLAISPGGNVGRGRFELRKAQLALESEFAL